VLLVRTSRALKALTQAREGALWLGKRIQSLLWWSSEKHENLQEKAARFL